jgi:hypothetical protein
MSKRNLIIAAAVLVLLAFVSQWFGRSANEVNDEKIGKPLLAANQVEAFDELIIKNAENTLTLNKQGDRWVVKEKQEYPADMKKLLELMDKLTQYKVASLVTNEESRQPHFQVVAWDNPRANAEASGTQLTLNHQGQSVFAMMTGKQRQSKGDKPEMPAYPDGVYVRIGESPAIYVLKDNLNLETDPDEWIQTSLFTLDKKEIKAVGVESPSSRFQLERPEKGKEMVLNGLAANEQTTEFEVSTLLSDLEDFKIDEIFIKSEVPEKTLELKAVITVTPYDLPELQFNVLIQSDRKQSAPKEKAEEPDLIYFVSFNRPATTASDARWNVLYDLNDTWIFKVDDWKAKHWLKTRKDFIEKPAKK